MTIRCPLCEEYISSDVKLQDGQHIRCPMCEKKFSFFYNSPSEKEEEQLPIIISSGEEFEDFLCEKINELPYVNCQKTKATGDQGVDLIVEVGGKKIAVQCKLYSYPVGNDAVQQVIAGKVYYKCDEAIVVSNASFTTAAKELASTAGVLLVNYRDIKTEIKNFSEDCTSNESEDVILEKALSRGDFRTAEKSIVKMFLSSQPTLKSAFLAVSALMKLTECDSNFVFSKDAFLLLARYYYNLACFCQIVVADNYRRELNRCFEEGALSLDTVRVVGKKIKYYGFDEHHYYNKLSIVYFLIAGECEDAAYLEDFIKGDRDSIYVNMPNPKYGLNRLMIDVFESFRSKEREMENIVMSIEDNQTRLFIRAINWVDHPKLNTFLTESVDKETGGCILA